MFGPGGISHGKIVVRLFDHHRPCRPEHLKAHTQPGRIPCRVDPPALQRGNHPVVELEDSGADVVNANVVVDHPIDLPKDLADLGPRKPPEGVNGVDTDVTEAAEAGLGTIEEP